MLMGSENLIKCQSLDFQFALDSPPHHHAQPRMRSAPCHSPLSRHIILIVWCGETGVLGQRFGCVRFGVFCHFVFVLGCFSDLVSSQIAR